MGETRQGEIVCRIGATDNLYEQLLEFKNGLDYHKILDEPLAFHPPSAIWCIDEKPLIPDAPNSLVCESILSYCFNGDVRRVPGEGLTKRRQLDERELPLKNLLVQLQIISSRLQKQ